MTSLKLTLVLLFTAGYSYCQEINAQYEFLGFSADQKFMAFEMHTGDELNGNPGISKIYIVDVAKNNYATKTMTLNGKEGQEPEAVSAQNKKNAQANLTKFGITPGKNLGTQVPLVTHEGDRGRIEADDIQSFKISNVSYKVELKTYETGETHEAYMVPKLKFGLFVSPTNNPNKVQTLQKDGATVPASRGFVTGYTILSIWHIDDKLAVFLEYRNPGFEGSPDRFQMVVTGVLR